MAESCVALIKYQVLIRAPKRHPRKLQRLAENEQVTKKNPTILGLSVDSKSAFLTLRIPELSTMKTKKKVASKHRLEPFFFFFYGQV